MKKPSILLFLFSISISLHAHFYLDNGSGNHYRDFYCSETHSNLNNVSFFPNAAEVCNNPSPFNFTSTFSNLTAGQTVTLTWTGGCPNWLVDLSLVRITPFVVQEIIAEDVPNSGSYTWTIPACTPPGDYQFYIEEGIQTITWHYGQIFALAASNSCCPSNGIIYVNHAASGNNTGQNWTDAFNDLQPAIDLAANCPGVPQIWVAQGTYYPTHDNNGNSNPSNPRNKVFYIDADTEIYGGFIGNENQLFQRDFKNNLTILSGDIDNNDSANPAASYTDVVGNNSYRVVIMKNNTQACLLDGFTVTAGNTGGEGSGIVVTGGGSGNSANPRIHNCTLSGNKAFRGGGMLLSGGGGGNNTTSLKNCIFYGNKGTQRAGALYISGWNGGSSSPTLENCLFYKNESQTGAAIFTLENNQQTNFINCTFYGNLSPDRGGASFNFNADPIFTNCIFWANTGNGKTVYNLAGATPHFENCLIQEASCGALHGTNSCTNSIFGQDPLVVNAASDDYHLLSASPAIDAGTFTNAPADDLDGLSRPQMAGIDMGVYEHLCNGSPIICFQDNDGDGYGDNLSPPQIFCDACGPGFVQDSLDCDDGDPNINPGATEICNSIDDDCDGLIDAADPDFIDSVNPTALCQNAITVAIDPTGNVALTPIMIDLGSFDDCTPMADLTFNVSPNPLNCTNLGANIVTLTVYDDYGNQNACTSTVNVIDNTKPVFATCPSYPNPFSTDLGHCFATINFTLPNVSDNCAVTELKAKITELNTNQVIQNWTANPNGQYSPGNYKIKWRAKDASGNKKTCSKTFQVIDDENPVARCKPTIIVPLVGGAASITTAHIDNSTSDNCPFTLSLSQTNFDCTHLGTNTVTLFATDDSGNTDNCAATVFVKDPSTVEVVPLTQAEGSPSGFTFFFTKVIRTGDDTCPLFIDWNTSDGTATTSDNDYMASNGLHVWPANNSGLRYSIVRVIKDTKLESDESFLVELDGPATTINAHQTIQNDDSSSLMGNSNDDNILSQNDYEAAKFGFCDSKENDIYIGNIVLLNQLDVDAFPSCIAAIDGNLYIEGKDITDLSALSDLQVVGGEVTIKILPSAI